MPVPKKNFKGKAIVTCDFHEDIFRYDDICDMEHEYAEIIECEIDPDQLEINDHFYKYDENKDVFWSLDYEKYDTFIRVHFIFDKCELCGIDNYLVNYCLKDKWICNNCICGLKNRD
jgi:hypothetical protein